MREYVMCRLVIITVFAAGLGTVASADRASSTLAVSVTVVRSCAVAAAPSGGGSALLELRCPAGAASTARASGAVEVQPEQTGVRRLQAPTTEFRGSGSRPDVWVVTVNF